MLPVTAVRRFDVPMQKDHLKHGTSRPADSRAPPQPGNAATRTKKVTQCNLLCLSQFGQKLNERKGFPLILSGFGLCL